MKEMKGDIKNLRNLIKLNLFIHKTNLSYCLKCRKKYKRCKNKKWKNNAFIKKYSVCYFDSFVVEYIPKEITKTQRK